MRTQKNAVVVCGDAGGAAAVAPIAHALASEPAIDLSVYSYRQATGLFGRENISSTELNEDMLLSECVEILQNANADFLLSGTSVNGIDLERTFTAAAHLVNIPSLAVLDFWLNYRRRFENRDGLLEDLPTRIAVMDEHARHEMVSAGFSANILEVTGQPAFDALTQMSGHDRDSVRAKIRSELSVRDDELLIVFVSQPLADFYGKNLNADGHLGYTEHTVLPVVIRHLEEVFLRQRSRIHFWLRRHPRERAANYDGVSLPESSLRFIETQVGTGRESVLAADAVIGMSSILLLEAAILGRRVLSFQPNLKLPDGLPLQRLAIGKTVSIESELPDAIESILSGIEDPSKGVGTHFVQGATARCVQLICDLMNRHSILEPTRKACRPN